MNPRQQELRQKMAEMVKRARDKAFYEAEKKGCAPKDVYINTEQFLAEFEVYNFASPYASRRYYDRFVMVGIFVEGLTKTNQKIFQVEWIEDYAGVPFPSKKEWDG